VATQQRCKTRGETKKNGEGGARCEEGEAEVGRARISSNLPIDALEGELGAIEGGEARGDGDLNEEKAPGEGRKKSLARQKEKKQVKSSILA